MEISVVSGYLLDFDLLIIGFVTDVSKFFIETIKYRRSSLHYNGHCNKKNLQELAAREKEQKTKELGNK